MRKGKKFSPDMYLDARAANAALTYKEVRAEYKRLVKKRNRRIEGLNRAGIELQSMSRAYSLVNGQRFRTISHVNSRQLRRQLSRIQVFLNTQGSSVAALRSARARQREALREIEKGGGNGIYSNINSIDAFFNTIRHIFKGLIEPSSEAVMDVYSRYIRTGDKRRSEVLQDFNTYVEGIEE